jgi:hypothetical protein
MKAEFALVMAGAAAAHQAAAASRQGNGQQRADRTRRTTAGPQRAQQGATAAAADAPAALQTLSRLQHLADASPQVAQLRRLQALADGRFAPVAQLAGDPEEEVLVQGKFATAQRQPQLQQAPRANNTGLPDKLKSGIESLSGLSMDHVRVHYNSSQPAQLNALAYAQGSDIHLAPGQEQHLPHEAWHVVQQAQGRVRPTLQMNEGVQVNDDVGLEREADVMGTKALGGGHRADEPHRSISLSIETAQKTEGGTTNSPDLSVASNHSDVLTNCRGSAQRGENEVQRIADQRPEAALQRQVQAWGDGSERVGQLRAWQGVAEVRVVGGKRQDFTPGCAMTPGYAMGEKASQIWHHEAPTAGTGEERGPAAQRIAHSGEESQGRGAPERKGCLNFLSAVNLQKALAGGRVAQCALKSEGKNPQSNAGHEAGLKAPELLTVIQAASFDTGSHMSAGGVAQATVLPVAANGPVAVIQRGRKGGSKKQNKGRGPKSRQQIGPSRPEKGMESADEFNEDDDVSHYVMAEEGAELGKYEEEYESPVLFWRGDDRGPDAVFETGFTTKRERDKEVKGGANKIIWRSGGSTDDILPASAVCLAKDVRGSAFFPLTGAPAFYMYAVGKTRAVNTFKAQQRADQAETGSHDFRQEGRYGYDPNYSESDKASAVWQFQEYAAHRVRSDEILACFEVTRRTLVPANGNDNVAIAGIQFKLEFVKDGPIYDVRRTNKALFKQLTALQEKAKSESAKYENYYPDEQRFLSYMGIVAPKDSDDMPQNLGEAKNKVKQIQPIVVQEKPAPESVGGTLTVQKQDDHKLIHKTQHHHTTSLANRSSEFFMQLKQMRASSMAMGERQGSEQPYQLASRDARVQWAITHLVMAKDDSLFGDRDDWQSREVPAQDFGELSQGQKLIVDDEAVFMSRRGANQENPFRRQHDKDTDELKHKWLKVIAIGLPGGFLQAPDDTYVRAETVQVLGQEKPPARRIALRSHGETEVDAVSEGIGAIHRAWQAAASKRRRSTARVTMDFAGQETEDGNEITSGWNWDKHDEGTNVSGDMKDSKEREKFEEVHEQHVLSAHYDEAHDEQPIAYMVLEVRTYEGSRFMYIRWLIGHPEKGGGGSQLVNEAIERFKNSGLSELRVDSAFSAVGWYESLGFQKVVPEKSVAIKGVGYADTELVYRSE